MINYRKFKLFFCFMDETGHLRKDPYFLLSTIKIQFPNRLTREIQRLRDRHRFYNEIKFEKISEWRFRVYKELIDLFCSFKDVKFRCVVIQRQGYKKPIWQIYNKYTKKLIKDNCGKREILCIWADEISTPAEDDFDIDIRKYINSYFKRLALFGICRVPSHPVDLVQFVDLIGGIVLCGINLETKAKIIYSERKKKLVAILKKQLKIKEFSKSINLPKIKINATLSAKSANA